MPLIDFVPYRGISPPNPAPIKQLFKNEKMLNFSSDFDMIM